MTLTQQILLVAVAVIATMLTRFIPFIVFRPGKSTPKYILYLGKVLPASVFALLVIYCLRHTFFMEQTSVGNWHFAWSANAMAQTLSIVLTITIHLWRKNMMWSIAAGTICYMVLIRIM